MRKLKTCKKCGTRTYLVHKIKVVKNSLVKSVRCQHCGHETLVSEGLLNPKKTRKHLWCPKRKRVISLSRFVYEKANNVRLKSTDRIHFKNGRNWDYRPSNLIKTS